MDKAILKIMALAERLMDEGKLKWVMAPSPLTGQLERMPVTDHVLKELGLVHNQTVNSILVDAIAEAHENELIEKSKDISAKIEKAMEKFQESQLTEDFDFRSMMGNDEDKDSTRH